MKVSAANKKHLQRKGTSSNTLISIVIPVYNELANLQPLYTRLTDMAAKLPTCAFEFLFVDDCSTDGTAEAITRSCQVDARVKLIRFSRNFGSHVACLAGLTYGSGNCFVIMSGDLQDPPEVIPQMLEKINSGYDIVLGDRSCRDDPWLAVLLAGVYHHLMRWCAIRDWPARGTDFMMMRKVVRDVIVRWRQKNTSIMGQVIWLGFRRTFAPYTRERRGSGRSKWTLKKKVKLVVDSLATFSSFPLRVISYSGLLLSAAGFINAVLLALQVIVYRNPVSGWLVLLAAFLLVSGFQLLMLGVIGEYLWRVADEVRGPPPYIVESAVGLDLL